MELITRSDVKIAYPLQIDHMYRDTDLINPIYKTTVLSRPASVTIQLAGELLLVAAVLLIGTLAKPVLAANASCPSTLNHTFPRLQDEKPVSLCEQAGKVLLVVNTASYCGYTGQYEELEKLQQQYSAKGFSVVGFPSNDFGGQEPKSNKQIAEFCTNTFGVKFPMMAKSSVRGASANPFYKQLANATGQEPAWNFHKYLIDRHGKVIGAYPSGVSPLSNQLTSAIRSALEAPTR